jgi:hypothetical protein
MLLCVKQGFLEYQTLLISRVKRFKYKIILFSVKVSIYSDKKIAAELPTNFEISAAIFCRRRFIKIARTAILTLTQAAHCFSSSLTPHHSILCFAEVTRLSKECY